MDNKFVDKLLNVAISISNGEVPPYQHNECFTSGAFDLLLLNIHGSDAFELLSVLCKQYNNVKKEQKNIKGYVYLLDLVARQSNTTEMPIGMDIIINENPDLSISLKEWYRL